MAASDFQLLIEEEENGKFAVVLHHSDGTEERLPAATPAADLIAATEIDYTGYRREIKRLWDEHPLFEERIDVSVSDFYDLVSKVRSLPSMLREIDPVSFYFLEESLPKNCLEEDDGSAPFLLYAGANLLRTLEKPIRVQTLLRNIFEMTFDKMERATQEERFEKLRRVYPDIAEACDPARLSGIPEGGRSFVVSSLLDLRLLELTLYFQQDTQRIARCEYCWGYFIPRTKKLTLYCDRVTDGYRCKDRGSRFNRNRKKEQDEALLICDQMRDRMYERFLRYQDAVPSERSGLLPMDHDQYNAWSENARLARIEYVAGKLTSEEFLRRIDTAHVLTSYEAGKAELVDETVWQRRVAANIQFDPAIYYPEKMMNLDLRAAEPQWELFTADDFRRHDQEGHQSLREQYGKGNS